MLFYFLYSSHCCPLLPTEKSHLSALPIPCSCPPPPLLCLGYLTDPFLSQLNSLILGKETWSFMQREFRAELLQCRSRWTLVRRSRRALRSSLGGRGCMRAPLWDAQTHRGPGEGCPTPTMCCLPQLYSQGTHGLQVTAHLWSWGWGLFVTQMFVA